MVLIGLGLFVQASLASVGLRVGRPAIAQRRRLKAQRMASSTSISRFAPDCMPRSLPGRTGVPCKRPLALCPGSKLSRESFPVKN